VLAFFAGSAGFALAALLFLLLPRRADDSERVQTAFTTRGMFREIKEGMQWFLADRLVRAAAVMAAVANLFSSATLGILVLYAQDELGVGTARYGWLLTGEAIGGTLGGIIAGRMVRKLGGGPVIFISNALPAVGYAILYFASSYYVAWAALSISAFAVVLGNIVVITLRQTAVPEELVGRVTSSYRLVALGAVPLGGLLGGWLASQFGVRTPFLAGAFTLLLLAIAVAPIMTTRALKEASSGRQDAADATP
jgi:MFS family permease